MERNRNTSPALKVVPAENERFLQNEAHVFEFRNLNQIVCAFEQPQMWKRKELHGSAYYSFRQDVEISFQTDIGGYADRYWSNCLKKIKVAIDEIVGHGKTQKAPFPGPFDIEDLEAIFVRLYRGKKYYPLVETASDTLANGLFIEYYTLNYQLEEAVARRDGRRK